MDIKIVFGKKEAVTLLINMICTKMFLNFARMTAETAGTAGWILATYISVLAFVLFFFISKLFSKFEGKDILDVARIAGGKIVMIFCGLVIVLLLLYIVSVVLREFSEDMKVISLPVSPLSYVMMFFMAGVIVGCYLGIEAIVRYHAFIVPVIATGFLLILLGAVRNYDLSYIQPLLGNGAGSIFGSGFFKVSVFAELIILFLLPPFLKTNRNFRSVGYISLGFSAFFLISGTFVYLITFPYPSNLEPFLPIYQLARLINYGRFFQRVESLFVVIWVLAAVLYLASGFYFMLYTFAKTFGIKYLRPLIAPFAVLVFSLAFLPKSLVAALDLETEYFRNTAWVVTFGLTIVLLLIARIRTGKRKEAGVRDA